MDDRLYTTLLLHNPWMEQRARQRSMLARHLPRRYVPRAGSLALRPGKAQLVIGPRQCGKSTWIRYELSLLDDPVLILHGEEPRVQELCSSPAQVLAELEGAVTAETILVFEETQHLAEAPLLLKGLVDLRPGLRIVATGSSSFQFHARTRESLAGRAVRCVLLPFSLGEVSAVDAGDTLPAVFERHVRAQWERMLLWGSYPEPWLADNPALLLHQLVESFVLRDASDLHVIKDLSAFRRVLELAAEDIGNLVNVSEWAGLARISSQTVNRYLDIAAEAHVLRLVRPFVGGKRAELTGTPKVFFLDAGLRNAILGRYEPVSQRADRGALWENAVCAELLKRLDLLDRVRYWRTRSGAEVDFVVQRGQELIGIEVKAGEMMRPRIPRSVRSFIQAYRPCRFGIINASLRTDEVIEGVPCLFRRPWELHELL